MNYKQIVGIVIVASLFHACNSKAEREQVMSNETLNNNSGAQFMSVSPILVEAPDRLMDMELRVSAPLVGENLPIILISHGVGRANLLSSYRGYDLLIEHFAPNGFLLNIHNKISNGKDFFQWE